MTELSYTGRGVRSTRLEDARPGARLARAALLAATCLGLVACGGQAELPDDGPSIKVSTQDAMGFLTKAFASTEGVVEGGEVRFTVTQEQVTSFLNLGSQLAQAAQDAGIEVPGLDEIGGQQALDQLKNIEGFDRLQELTRLLPGSGGGADGGFRLPDLRLRLLEPEVYFKGDGRVILRGYGQFLNWRQPLRVVIAPSAKGGDLTLDFIEGQIGSVSLPEFLFDPMGKLLARAILAGQEYAEITEISVAEGTFTLAGRRGP